MMKTTFSRLVLLTTAVVLFALTGCSAQSSEDLAPGQCIVNKDCKKGTKCVDGWCEDIYHPRREIQPL